MLQHETIIVQAQMLQNETISVQAQMLQHETISVQVQMLQHETISVQAQMLQHETISVQSQMLQHETISVQAQMLQHETISGHAQMLPIHFTINFIIVLKITHLTLFVSDLKMLGTTVSMIIAVIILSCTLISLRNKQAFLFWQNGHLTATLSASYIIPKSVFSQTFLTNICSDMCISRHTVNEAMNMDESKTTDECASVIRLCL